MHDQNELRVPPMGAIGTAPKRVWPGLERSEAPEGEEREDLSPPIDMFDFLQCRKDFEVEKKRTKNQTADHADTRG